MFFSACIHSTLAFGADKTIFNELALFSSRQFGSLKFGNSTAYLRFTAITLTCCLLTDCDVARLWRALHEGTLIQSILKFRNCSGVGSMSLSKEYKSLLADLQTLGVDSFRQFCRGRSGHLNLERMFKNYESEPREPVMIFCIKRSIGMLKEHDWRSAPPTSWDLMRSPFHVVSFFASSRTSAKTRQTDDSGVLVLDFNFFCLRSLHRPSALGNSLVEGSTKSPATTGRPILMPFFALALLSK